MLWVQLPPGPVSEIRGQRSEVRVRGQRSEARALADQAGVVATLSRWRAWVRIPSRVLEVRNSELERVGWALASLSGCNPPADLLCRFNSCPTHSYTFGVRIQSSELQLNAETRHSEFRNVLVVPAEWPPAFQAGDRGFESRPGYWRKTRDVRRTNPVNLAPCSRSWK